MTAAMTKPAKSEAPAEEPAKVGGKKKLVLILMVVLVAFASYGWHKWLALVPRFC